MSAKKLTKKDLKEDSFVTFMINAWEYAREHQNQLFVALVVIIIVVAALIWNGQSRMHRRVEAANKFSESLTTFRRGEIGNAEALFREVIQTYDGTREGTYSRYFAGKCALLQGKNVEAIEAFEDYLNDGKKYPFFVEASLAGKAVALENMQNFGEAAEIYLDLVRSYELNEFDRGIYLRRAAETLKLSNQNHKAAEVLEELLETATGLDRRQLEVEIELLGG